MLPEQHLPRWFYWPKTTMGPFGIRGCSPCWSWQLHVRLRHHRHQLLPHLLHFFFLHQGGSVSAVGRSAYLPCEGMAHAIGFHLARLLRFLPLSCRALPMLPLWPVSWLPPRLGVTLLLSAVSFAGRPSSLGVRSPFFLSRLQDLPSLVFLERTVGVVPGNLPEIVASSSKMPSRISSRSLPGLPLFSMTATSPAHQLHATLSSTIVSWLSYCDVADNNSPCVSAQALVPCGDTSTRTESLERDS